VWPAVRRLVHGWERERRSPPRAAQELHVFRDDPKFAALLPGLLVVPLVKTQAAFDEHGAALAHVLADVLRRPPKHVHVDKGDFLFLLARLGRPDAVDGQADFGDGLAIGGVAQFRVAREVANEDHFVEAGHKSDYLAALGAERP